MKYTREQNREYMRTYRQKNPGKFNTFVFIDADTFIIQREMERNGIKAPAGKFKRVKE